MRALQVIREHWKPFWAYRGHHVTWAEWGITSVGVLMFLALILDDPSWIGLLLIAAWIVLSVISLFLHIADYRRSLDQPKIYTRDDLGGWWR